MPVPSRPITISLGDDTFRPLLRDDMISAWALEQVHYDAPKLPGDSGILPRGFIELGDVEPRNAYGMTRGLYLYPYRLVGQFAYPDDGTIEEARIDRAQELLDVLTAGMSIYHDDYRYRDVVVPFAQARQMDDAEESVYHVIVDIVLQWESGV